MLTRGELLSAGRAHEHVRTPVVWFDEAVTTLVVEPNDDPHAGKSRVVVLEEALIYIGNRRIMDGVTAISMRAVANGTLKEELDKPT
jgi:hypothetical protein